MLDTGCPATTSGHAHFAGDWLSGAGPLQTFALLPGLGRWFSFWHELGKPAVCYISGTVGANLAGFYAHLLAQLREHGCKVFFVVAVK